jgi:hypothetical protein
MSAETAGTTTTAGPIFRALPLFGPRNPTSANTDFVLVKNDGSFVVTRDYPSLFDRIRPRYRSAFEVDMSTRQMSISTLFPSYGDAFDFVGDLRARWRVTNPVNAVSLGVEHPENLISTTLLAHFRRIVGRFRPDERVEAELAANSQATFGDLSPFSITDCKIFLKLDEPGRTLLRDLTEKERYSEFDEQRLRRFRAYAEDNTALLALHLANNPTDTRDVLQAIIDFNAKRLDIAATILRDLIGSDTLASMEAHGTTFDVANLLKQVVNNLDSAPWDADPRQLESIPRETLEQQLQKINAAEAETTGDLVEASVYTISEDGSDLKRAFLGVAESFGFTLAGEDPAISGSWFQKIWLRVKDSASSEPVSERLHKIEKALELNTLGKARAEVDREKANAVGVLLQAVAQQDSAVLRLGSLVIVKARGQVAAWTISEVEAAALEENSSLVRNPAEILKYLQSLETATCTSLDGQADGLGQSLDLLNHEDARGRPAGSR